MELDSPFVKHTGGCHCGQIQFEVDAPAEIDVSECNCSICSKTGFLHLIISKSRFRLLRGAAYLSTYKFNTGVAEHLFCKVCGIKSFYVPRSNPDGYSVNVRCIVSSSIMKIRITRFDGQNWEQHEGELSHFSNDEKK